MTRAGTKPDKDWLEVVEKPLRSVIERFKFFVVLKFFCSF